MSKHRKKTDETQQVGYGRPPLHTRFKKGQSGNPNGRPRTKDLAQLLRREGNRRVTVRLGDRTVRTTILEATVRNLWALAAKGDSTALKLLWPFIQSDPAVALRPTIILSGRPADMDNEQLYFERIGEELDRARAAGGKASGRSEK